MGGAAETVREARQRWERLPRWVRWPVLGGVGLGAIGVVLLAFLWVTVDLPSDPSELQSAVLVTEGGDELAVLSRRDSGSRSRWTRWLPWSSTR